MKNILFFGDSLTEGYGLRNKATESFPALIQQKINLANLNYQVINAGLSGDTSAGGLQRIDYWLTRPIDAFVLELGVNDVIRRISADTTSKNLQAIINKVRSKYPEIKIALMGMEIPVSIPGNGAMQFKEIFRNLALYNKLAFVPFFLEGVAGKQHLNLPDRLHPSADGYKIIAEKVWPLIEKLINEN